MKINMILLLVWITFHFISCNDSTQNEIDKMLAAAPENNYEACGNAIVGAYNLNYTDFIDKGDIKWYVRNYPIGTKEKVINQSLEKVTRQYQNIIQIPFAQVFGRDSLDADIIFEFKYIDGKKGQYGITIPHYDSARKKKFAVITIDLIDYLQRINEKDFFFETALHESGHAVGLGHSEYKFAVMYPWATPIKRNQLTIDEAAGLRNKYGLNRDFELNGKKYYYISATGRRQLTKNFNEREFLKKCTPRESHYLAAACVDAAQAVRDDYGTVTTISSFRDLYCNIYAHGAKDSRHMYRDAIDLKLSAKMHAKFVSDIYNKKPILGTLIGLGIRGFGSYPYKTFHLDARPVSFSPYSYSGIPYIGWGDMVRPFALMSSQDEYKIYD